jgi:hypothetical protein
MKLALVNHSTFKQVTADGVQRIAAAVQRQGYEHFAQMWQRDGVELKVFANLRAVDADYSTIAIVDDSDQAGDLGYHTFQALEGKAWAPIFARPCFENGGTLMAGASSLSVTISHEYLETIGDPYANTWVDTPDLEMECQELCDRVEGDSYEIDGVAVSNFLGPPRAFRNGPGPYDWLKLLKAPFDMRPGGYRIRRDGGPKTNARSDFAAQFPQWKLEMARFVLPAARLGRRGFDARLLRRVVDVTGEIPGQGKST